jgi:thiol-disulfide isomerase/thioredoxin
MLGIHTGFLGLLARCSIALLAFMCLPSSPSWASGQYILSIHSPKAFPKMQFKDEKGTVVDLADIRSPQLTVVHFWATWCAPCIDELPELDAISRKYGPKGLKVVTVSLDGEANGLAVSQFFKDNNIKNLPVYLDIGTDAFYASSAKGMPTSFFIDAAGDQIAVAEGMLDWTDSRTTGFLEFNLRKAH